MDEMLLFLETLLAPEALPPRRILVDGTAKLPALLYTDASHNASFSGLGFVFIDPANPHANCFASASPPTWITQEFNSSADRYPAPPLKLGETRAKTKTRQIIAQLECLAAINALLTLGPSLRGRHLWLFIDNTWCLTSFVHGYANRPDMARLSTIFSLLKARFNIDAFCEYVPSKLNIADLPSRPTEADWSPLHDLSLRQTEMIPLAESQWNLPSTLLRG